MIPPFEDFLRPPEQDSFGEPADVGEMIAKACFGTEPLLKSPAPGSFAARPGRQDSAEILLKQAHARFQPGNFQPPARSAEVDLTELISKIVAAQLTEKAAAAPPPKMKTARETESEWDWNSTIIGQGEGELPSEPVEPSAIAASIEADSLTKRAQSESRKNGLALWMKKRISEGETVSSLAAFAESNGHAAVAEELRAIGKEL